MIKTVLKAASPKNQIDISVIKPSGEVKTSRFINTVTLATMANIYGEGGGLPFSQLFSHIGLGTGGDPITRSSLDLTQPVPAMQVEPDHVSVSTVVENGDTIYSMTLVKLYSPDILDPGTYSEIGLYGIDPQALELTAGTLIKDELGDPSPIEIVQGDALLVTYKISIVKPNVPMLTGTHVIGGQGCVVWIDINPIVVTDNDIRIRMPVAKLEDELVGNIIGVPVTPGRLDAEGDVVYSAIYDVDTNLESTTIVFHILIRPQAFNVSFNGLRFAATESDGSQKLIRVMFPKPDSSMVTKLGSENLAYGLTVVFDWSE